MPWTRFKKGFASIVVLRRPTAETVEASAIAILAIQSTPLKKEPFPQFLALTKRVSVTLSKRVTLSPFLVVPKKKAPLHGARESPLLVSATKIHPVRPNGGRLSVETDRWSYPFDQSKDVGSNRHFFLSKMDKTAHRSAPSLPPHIFSNRKKICFAVSST